MLPQSCFCCGSCETQQFSSCSSLVVGASCEESSLHIPVSAVAFSWLALVGCPGS
jgi:hypothetical protein